MWQGTYYRSLATIAGAKLFSGWVRSVSKRRSCFQSHLPYSVQELPCKAPINFLAWCVFLLA